ncbi:MAG: TPR end-of-group domain-containing protein [Beijerinckiaceae bacterium]
MLTKILFQNIAVDLERLALSGPSGAIDLRPKSFEMLRYFAEHARRVLPKEELLDAMWPNVTVTEESLTRCISEIRKAIGDEDQKILRTIPRRGYLFDPVDLSFEPRLNADPPHRLQATPAADRRQSVAVLPFANLSGDPEQEYFSDGITEDLITDLSKLSGLRVATRIATIGYKGRTIDTKLIGENLGVNFILDGSVRKAGGRVRVSAQLIDAETSGHVWADRFDRELNDIFVIQDEINRAIVAQLRVRLLPGENAMIGHATTRNVEAYSYYLRGREFLHRRSKPFLELARRMFVKALEVDPDYARAYAGVADCDSFLRLHYSADIDMESILATSAKALSLQDGLAEAHASRGLALSLLGRYADAMAAFDDALGADPDLFEAHYFCARACVSQGRHEQAAHHFKRAAEINPADCQTLLVLTGVLRSLGRKDEMMSAAREGVIRAERELAMHPENPRPAYLGAGGLAILGEMDRASEWAARALVIDPTDVLTLYNGACFYAISGDYERALDLLLEVLPRAGRQTKDWVRHDSDFDPMRTLPRFKDVLKLLD